MADFKLTAKVLITEATIQAKALSRLKNIKINVNAKALNQANTQAQALSKTLQNVSQQANMLNKNMGRTGRASSSVNKVNRSVRQLSQSTAQAAKGGKDMVAMFEEIGRRALAFRVAATFINTFTDSVSDAIQFLRTFDQELTDIAKIGGQSSQELERIGESLLSLASKWGAAAEDTIGQFRTFTQAGFDAAASMKFAEKATIGAAGTTLELNKATELLIQTMKVFGDTEADKVFDKIAVAESSAAVTAADVQDAMKRSAATFRAVNASVDDMIGLISSLQETSRRGGAVVGTAFRTINTRIFAGDTRKEVEKLGVAVTDSTGQLRPLVTVLSDLSLKFKTLTQEEQVQAATLIAGRRQFESFLQIINNVDRAQQISAQTANQQGEAMKRAEMQARTLNGRLNSLRDTFLKMVTGIEEFVPIRDIFKTLISLIDTLIGSFDGALGKVAALSALFIGMRAAVPVFKGLSKVFGRAGGAFGPMLAGGLGLGAGGFGIGKGQQVQNKYMSPLGIQQTQTTVASPYTPKYDKQGNRQRRPFKQMIASTKAMNIAALATGASLMIASSVMKDVSDETRNSVESTKERIQKLEGMNQTEAVSNELADERRKLLSFEAQAAREANESARSMGKQFVDMGATVATAFAFGSIAGGITAVGLAVSKIANAWSTAADRSEAYRKSLAEFGDKTLAGMEAALVDFRAEGDSVSASLLENAIAFSKAKDKLAKDPEIFNVAGENIANMINQLREQSGGLNITSKDLRQRVETSLAKSGFKSDEIQGLLGDPRIFRQFVESAGIELGKGGNEWTSFVNHVKGELTGLSAREFTVDLSDIMDTADFVNEMNALHRSLMESEVAMQVFEQGITDSIAIRKLEAEQALKLADQSVMSQKEVFATMIKEFVNLEDTAGKLDFRSLYEAFEGASGQGRGLPDSEKALTAFKKILLENDIVIEDVIEEMTGLHSGFLSIEQALVDQRSAIADYYNEIAAIELDATLTKLKDLREEREREQDVVTSLTNAIAGLNIEGGIDGVGDAFNRLSAAITDGVIQLEQTPLEKELGAPAATIPATTEALSDLLGVVHDLKNPIAQARRELEKNHAKNMLRVNDLNDDRIAIEGEIAALKALEPSQKRNEELKKREAEQLKIMADLEKARGKTLNDAERDIKKVTVAREKAEKNLLEAQEKALESTNDLSKAVQEWAESLAEGMNEADANAQEELKEAQMAVIESTESLVDAYNDLKMAQLELGDAVADYKVGTGLAAMQVDIITGNIRGFQAQMNALQNVFNEAADVADFSTAAYDQAQNQMRSLANAASAAGISFMVSGGQMIRATEITEQKRLELMREAANKQLELVQGVIDETLSIGQRVFTMGGGDQSSLSRGLSALQNVAGQFTSAGGFGGVDLNEFGNTLMTLPQSLREEMVNALSFLPSTATLGGLTKEELEKILFGAAVGESEQAGIEHIAELTDKQVELIQQIAELDMAGILTAEASLEEAKMQTQLAENQLKMDEFALEQAHNNVQEVRSEIKEAASIMQAVQEEVGNTLSERITESTLEDLAERQQQHMARLSMLQSIDANTQDFASSIGSLRDAISNLNVAQGVVGGAYSGHIPRNYARGNMSEYAGLVRAYNREKRMGPAGSRPVIANDSELIIPTKNNGNIPNYQGGNAIFDTDDMEKLLASILEAIQVQTTQQAQVATGVTASGPTSQKVEATIQVNANQKVSIEGATSVAEAVASSVKNALNEHVSPDQMAAINEQILDLFNVLRDRGLVNSFGQG